MASTYSTNLALELIGTGDQSGAWGATNNTNLGTLIEQAISGYVTQAITDGADTVITIPNGASGVARNMYLELTGSLTAARNLVVPANKKLYFVYNNTTGGYAVTVKVSGQPGVSVPNGAKLSLVSNGTDIVAATSYITSITPGGSNTQVQYNNSGVFSGSALTYNSSTGGFTIPTPSSGVALSLSGFTGSAALSVTNTTSGSGSEYLQSWTNGTDTNLFVRLSQVGAATKFTSIENTTATPINIGTNSTTRLIVGSAGNVAISAATSGTTLNVGGGTTTGRVLEVSGSVAVYESASRNTPADFDWSSTTFRIRPYGASGAGFELHTTPSGGATTSRLAINSTGSVTVNAPSSAGTALAVTGIAGSAGLTVTGSASTPTYNIGTTVNTLTVDCSRSNVFYTTLTTAVNVSSVVLNNPQDGQTINIFVTQPSSGTAATMVGTWAKWPNGVAGVLSTTLGAVDLIVATYRSSTGFWYATLAKGFA